MNVSTLDIEMKKRARTEYLATYSYICQRQGLKEIASNYIKKDFATFLEKKKSVVLIVQLKWSPHKNHPISINLAIIYGTLTPPEHGIPQGPFQVTPVGCNEPVTSSYAAHKDGDAIMVFADRMVIYPDKTVPLLGTIETITHPLYQNTRNGKRGRRVVLSPFPLTLQENLKVSWNRIYNLQKDRSPSYRQHIMGVYRSWIIHLGHEADIKPLTDDALINDQLEKLWVMLGDEIKFIKTKFSGEDPKLPKSYLITIEQVHEESFAKKFARKREKCAGLRGINKNKVVVVLLDNFFPTHW
ncbi:hypothetical protein BDA99DRAFT_536213 [Phascolomyces articulosus]|uniref:Uncharacterized protein n=1 Tax=Phascolomyces articulosus TaxID=60185 RepID=A0AAD5K315_9FUNG|nr:hypothetical protein BDA99DRAFT_536213 [Phascolomyces articulosus]